jgi:hypothetical protein
MNEPVLSEQGARHGSTGHHLRVGRFLVVRIEALDNKKGLGRDWLRERNRTTEPDPMALSYTHERLESH